MCAVSRKSKISRVPRLLEALDTRQNSYPSDHLKRAMRGHKRERKRAAFPGAVIVHN
jgi:hypothetical protein